MRWETVKAARKAFGASWSELPPLRERLTAAAGAAERGDAREATERLLKIGHEFHSAGYPRLVLAALADLDKLIARSHQEQDQLGWILSLEALALSALGDREKARQALDQMLEIGRQLGDTQLTSTALQNLGIEALLRGDPREAIRLAQEALPLKLDLQDHFAACQLLSNIATVLVALDEYREAEGLLEEFRQFFVDLREPGLLTSFYGMLGQIKAARGAFAEAEDDMREALRLARRAGDLSKEVVSIQNLGALEIDRGRPGRGARWLRSAIRRAERADTSPQLELLYRSLALALHRSGRAREAIEWLQRARKAAAEFGDRMLWAGATADLGAAYVSRGDAEEGVALLEEAVAAYRELEAGGTETFTTALQNQAVALSTLGRPEDARLALEEAADVSHGDAERQADVLRQLAEFLAFEGDKTGAATALERQLQALSDRDRKTRAWEAATAGALLRDSGSAEDALRFYDVALDLYTRARDRHKAFDVRNDRALALVDLNRLDEAAKELRKCLRLADRLDDRKLQVRARTNLAEVERRAGRWREAISHLEKALELARELRDTQSEGDASVLLGIALTDAGRLDDAVEMFKSGRRTARHAQNKFIEANAVGGIARVEFLRGHYRRAARTYERAARLYPEATQQQMEDAAGWLLALAEAKLDRDVERAAQKLVDAAEDIRHEEFASDAFADAARRWLQYGELEAATSLYAISIVMGAIAGSREDDPLEMSKSAMRPIMIMLYHARDEGLDARGVASDVWHVLDRDYGGLGSQMDYILETAKEAVLEADEDKP